MKWCLSFLIRVAFWRVVLREVLYFKGRITFEWHYWRLQSRTLRGREREIDHRFFLVREPKPSSSTPDTRSETYGKEDSMQRILSAIRLTNEQGELAAIYRGSGRVWEITGWRPRLQENFRAPSHTSRRAVTMNTWETKRKGHFTHETESPWLFHFKHSHWWERLSQWSKFASRYAWGSNGVCECEMDVKSEWILTWHRMDRVSRSLGLFSRTTSWR